MKIEGREVYVFDNGGETVDRYSVIFEGTGNIYGASENPFHPLGVGQFCGDIYCSANPKHYIDDARMSPNWIGKEITDPSLLPEQVIEFIKQRE